LTGQAFRKVSALFFMSRTEMSLTSTSPVAGSIFSALPSRESLALTLIPSR